MISVKVYWLCTRLTDDSHGVLGVRCGYQSVNPTFWFFALLTIFFMLQGCHRHPYPLAHLNDSYKLPSRVAGTSDKKIKAMHESFRKKYAVKVVTIGQNYLIAFPSTAIFANQSPRVKWQGYGVLNQIASFMKQFRKVSVNVTAHTSFYKSTAREHALSQARAKIVADYLWSQDIDSRFIFSAGAGCEKPISVYTDGGDNSPNSRIEITFREAIV